MEVKLISFLKPHKAQLLIGLSALDRDNGISRDFMISPPYRAPILPLTYILIICEQIWQQRTVQLTRFP
jgi:hypothetical protein